MCQRVSLNTRMYIRTVHIFVCYCNPIGHFHYTLCGLVFYLLFPQASICTYVCNCVVARSRDNILHVRMCVRTYARLLYVHPHPLFLCFYITYRLPQPFFSLHPPFIFPLPSTPLLLSSFPLNPSPSLPSSPQHSSSGTPQQKSPKVSPKRSSSSPRHHTSSSTVDEEDEEHIGEDSQSSSKEEEEAKESEDEDSGPDSNSEDETGSSDGTYVCIYIC